MASKDEVLKAISELKSLYQNLRKAQGIKGLADVLPYAIDKVEQVSKNLGIKGADKKELALDILFALVKLPWYIPKGLARRVASHAIDATIAAIKKYQSKGQKA